MLGKLFKLGAYAKAPKSTFALLHPGKALKLGAALWVARKLFGSKKERVSRRPRAVRR
jgi:hypothetical protein